MSKDEGILWHQSGVNRDGEPFIQLIRNDQVIAQMSVAQAREHGLAILEAAEAAEQDAFLMHFAQDRLGVDQKIAAQILQDFRQFRRAETGKRSGQEVIPAASAKIPPTHGT